MVMEKLVAKYDVDRLELAEIEGECEKVSSEQYATQLIAYLVHNKLFEARFLWQRIPSQLKTSNPELEWLWNLCRLCVNNDATNAFALIDSTNWPVCVKEGIEDVRESLRYRLVHRVSKAYTCLEVSELRCLLGCNSHEETLGLIEKLKWRLDDVSGLVWPCKEERVKNKMAQNDDRLNRITDFISFLEK